MHVWCTIQLALRKLKMTTKRQAYTYENGRDKTPAFAKKKCISRCSSLYEHYKNYN